MLLTDLLIVLSPVDLMVMSRKGTLENVGCVVLVSTMLWSVKSLLCLWSRVWPCNPCFISNLSVDLNWAKLVVMQETGFSRVWFWQDLIKNMSSNKDMLVRQIGNCGWNSWERPVVLRRPNTSLVHPFSRLLCTVLILTFDFVLSFGYLQVTSIYGVYCCGWFVLLAILGLRYDSVWFVLLNLIYLVWQMW